jgi:hypothetical protein
MWRFLLGSANASTPSNTHTFEIGMGFPIRPHNNLVADNFPSRNWTLSSLTSGGNISDVRDIVLCTWIGDFCGAQRPGDVSKKSTDAIFVLHP